MLLLHTTTMIRIPARIPRVMRMSVVMRNIMHSVMYMIMATALILPIVRVIMHKFMHYITMSMPSALIAHIMRMRAIMRIKYDTTYAHKVCVGL